MILCIANSDECSISTMNANCPIRRFGTFGNKNQGLYCLTTVETLSLWHISSSQKLFDQQTLRSDFEGIDYLVNCLYNDTNDELVLISGSYEGNIQLFDCSNHRDDDNSNLSLKLKNIDMVNRHTDVVRAAVGLPNHTFATGGEDGMVCFNKYHV